MFVVWGMLRVQLLGDDAMEFWLSPVVEQETHVESCGAKAVEELAGIFAAQCLCRLEFQHDFVLRDHVGAEVAHDDPLVVHADELLAFDAHAAEMEFVCQRPSIDALEVPEAETIRRTLR